MGPYGSRPLIDDELRRLGRSANGETKAAKQQSTTPAPKPKGIPFAEVPKEQVTEFTAAALKAIDG